MGCYYFEGEVVAIFSLLDAWLLSVHLLGREEEDWRWRWIVELEVALLN